MNKLTFTIKAFEKLIKNSKWTHTSKTCHDDYDYEQTTDDAGNELQKIFWHGLYRIKNRRHKHRFY